MKENALQSQCLTFLARYFPTVCAINVHGGGWSAKGCPDLILCIRGRFVAFELKVGSNGMQSDQRIWKNRIERAGGLHFTPYSLREFEEIMEELTRD